MKKPGRITGAWIALILLTATSATIAEFGNASVFMIMFVGVITVVKGRLVIDQLMGLRSAPRVIRWMMRSYFYILPPLIILTVLLPGFSG